MAILVMKVSVSSSKIMFTVDFSFETFRQNHLKNGTPEGQFVDRCLKNSILEGKSFFLKKQEQVRNDETWRLTRPHSGGGKTFPAVYPLQTKKGLIIKTAWGRQVCVKILYQRKWRRVQNYTYMFRATRTWTEI